MNNAVERSVASRHNRDGALNSGLSVEISEVSSVSKRPKLRNNVRERGRPRSLEIYEQGKSLTRYGVEDPVQWVGSVEIKSMCRILFVQDFE